jgi:acid phosphatase (class A)
MRIQQWMVAGMVSVLCFGLRAQEVRQNSADTAAAKPAKTAYYFDATVLDANDLIPLPPPLDGAVGQAELAELHRIEETRTAAQVAQAVADDAGENIFAFKAVFGPGFTPEALPVTARLGDHVKNEQSVIGSQLKAHFERPRPYQADATLHPVCPVKAAHDSYPSGHALTGYLEALTLAELAPEKRIEILKRADEFAHNRLVCGVHYASDVEASRRIAYMVFGYMLATPRFQRDLAAAESELRPKLGLDGR